MANTDDGLACARARDRVGRRRPKLAEDQVALAQRLPDGREEAVRRTTGALGVPGATVYGHLGQAKTVPRRPRKIAVTKS
ncbi:hypothetical protein SUDANB6_05746 [Streptomyces sp. enrichment culture]|uniref:hypothetical protein n=1 Tax=Streptomyces sp. enrichment culture TaxID=1795815 RepID=UPI003F55BAA2